MNKELQELTQDILRKLLPHITSDTVRDFVLQGLMEGSWEVVPYAYGSRQREPNIYAARICSWLFYCEETDNSRCTPPCNDEQLLKWCNEALFYLDTHGIKASDFAFLFISGGRNQTL